MNISIIGLGLIGGSIARDLKSQINVQVSGVDSNAQHAKEALDLGLVHGMISLNEAMTASDIIIAAVPVDVLETILPLILDTISDKQILIDVGSTKEKICQQVKAHVNRGRFVAAHPLAGTEFSGPSAAMRGLFAGKKNIICDRELSDVDAVDMTIRLFESIGMSNIFMPSNEHDKHLAYVSHLSHVSSFMLGMTVLDIEKDEKQILNLAGTGFASTVRLAKSNPKTWSAIFDKNSEHLSTALGQYIAWLSKFKQAIDSGDKAYAEELMMKANEIKKVLPN